MTVRYRPFYLTRKTLMIRTQCENAYVYFLIGLLHLKLNTHSLKIALAVSQSISPYVAHVG